MVGAACGEQAVRAGSLDILAAQAQLVAPQMVVQRLHIGEDALGVRLLAHDHHVLHLHQGHAVHQHPWGPEQGLGLFGFYQPLLDQTAVELLDVRVHALPVRLSKPHHVLCIQELRAVRMGLGR